MSKMARELHDAHTRVLSPEQWARVKNQQVVAFGLTVREVEGKPCVAGRSSELGSRAGGC